jgi:hypothetical protein
VSSLAALRLAAAAAAEAAMRQANSSCHTSSGCSSLHRQCWHLRVLLKLAAAAATAAVLQPLQRQHLQVCGALGATEIRAMHTSVLLCMQTL